MKKFEFKIPAVITFEIEAPSQGEATQELYRRCANIGTTFPTPTGGGVVAIGEKLLGEDAAVREIP